MKNKRNENEVKEFVLNDEEQETKKSTKRSLFKERFANINKKTAIVTIILVIIGIILIILSLLSGKIFGEDSSVTKFFQENVTNTVNIVDWFKVNGPNLLKVFMQLIITIVVCKLLRILVLFILKRSNRQKTIANLISSFIKYFGAIVFIFTALNTFGVDTTTLLASAGIISLIIGLGAQSLIEDIIAGLFIIFENELQVGDIVVIGEFRGMVKEIGIRTTRIEDVGGNLKTINNSDIRSLINLTANLSIAECNVSIEYGESIQRVEAILKEIFPKIKKNVPTIVEGPFYKGVTELADSGVIIKIIAKCKEEDKYQTARDLNREIKIAFDENNINFPFPQVVINKPVEFEKPTTSQKSQSTKFVNEQKELTKDIETSDNNDDSTN